MAIVFATIGCCVAILVALLVSLNLLGYPVTLAGAIGYPRVWLLYCNVIFRKETKC